MERKNITLSNKPGIYTLIMACRHFGVEDVIICPGSRNAPLTLSFNRSGLFRCHSLADERSAGFFALGTALATGRPVAIVCTSGSAAANFAPALAEAFYLRQPVIAITADRPLAWTDQGNGQTIRQEGIYNNFTVDAFSLISEPRSSDDHWLNRRRLSAVFAKAIASNRGPIHINVPVSEPLYGMDQYSADATLFYSCTPTATVLPKSGLKAFANAFNHSEKVMILVGQMIPNEKLSAVLGRYAALPNVVILTETTSNIAVNGAVDTIDRLIMATDTNVVKTLMPQLLISLGGYIVSKKIKALLRETSELRHWHVNPYDEELDTFRNLTDEIHMVPEVFLKNLEPHLIPPPSDYHAQWDTVKQAAQNGHEEAVRSLPYSDLAVFRTIHLSLTKPVNLHIANSSPIRYIQLFGAKAGVHYYCNRGTSGIDGCSSTAVGFAKARGVEDHILITGDTAFLYDSNAFWNRNFPKNLKTIVINNGGGGIFRIIEGPKTAEELEGFFETEHPVDMKALATAYGQEYSLVESEIELSPGLNRLFDNPGPAILEIRTPKLKNPEVLRSYFDTVRQAISQQIQKSETGSRL